MQDVPNPQHISLIVLNILADLRKRWERAHPGQILPDFQAVPKGEAA